MDAFLLEKAQNTASFFNSLIKRTSTVPRHKEIDNFLAKKICRDLGIEPLKKRRK